MDDLIISNNKANYFLDLRDIFQNENPIFLEIGMGNGEFIVHMAKENPNANFIGIDVSKEIFRKALSRVKKSGLKNIRIMRIEGSEFLCKFVRSKTLSGVYINFPDPWSKKSRKERRLVNEPFIYLISDRLKEGGVFIFVSDDEDYAMTVWELLKKFTNFSPMWDDGLRTDFPEYYKTKYARKWLSLGLTIYYIGFRKERDVDLPEHVKKYYPLLNLSKEDLFMPLIEFKIKKTLNNEFIKEVLSILPRDVIYRDENTLIKILDVYHNERSILVDVLCVEGYYQQRFFVDINDIKKDILKIAIHDSDDPDPTLGVHRALAILASILKENFPELELVQNTTKVKNLT
ncbi:tRNA (guanosine(46)-N7)-methyltransferase TrmB [Dictyoglomus thermophilum]|uniref:tRNA (guanine-N(7)-)-methyltransferase n=1 Tax=Dictyoglomus thermophilum (strain ATCC 35947 / DSM 3960 / H-6-12) TaxID=309799 RepID=B5YFH8_DICT6|nr:tRNA (guanosine(46)-N7)-methyltransferase TrmB [Dictyoglomus thermophilum]ACI18807.1 tRNA (guanine-N(7)-)-methyltransferase (tRNA(m7G46)-methyltransferase) [Dictyoglomus thermophilum H-6-12]